MNNIFTLMTSQSKQVGRDKILIILAIYPLILATIGKYLVPVIQQSTLTSTFNLVNHYHTILVLFVVMNPFLYGDILGLMLLDERDDNTLTAIRTLPIKFSYYILSKTVMFFVASVVSGMLIIWLMDLYYITLLQSFLINFVSSMGVLFTMILINLFATNKVEGFAVMKITNIILLLPLVALYFKEPISYIFGIVPVFWPSIALSSLFNEYNAIMPYYIYLFIGFVYTIVITIVLYNNFKNKILLK